MTRKEQLQQSIEAADAARVELWRLEAQEAEDRNRAFIGKCFKYRNCFSCPQGPEDYWWMYGKVLSVQGTSIQMWQFQTDKYGEISISPSATCAQMTSNYQEIPLAEFNQAWQATMEKLERL